MCISCTILNLIGTNQGGSDLDEEPKTKNRSVFAKRTARENDLCEDTHYCAILGERSPWCLLPCVQQLCKRKCDIC